MASWWIDKSGNRSSFGVGMAWGYSNEDISSLPNYTSSDLALKDYDSCGNTDKIVAAGDDSTYPAAWATRKYAPTAETAGKWCLPAAGILMKIQNNQKAITTATSKVGGISNLYSYWMYSSSECSDRRVWLVSLSDSTYSDSKDINKGDTSSIFPVLEF